MVSTDILFRRELIRAGFRVNRAKSPEAMAKKLRKVFGDYLSASALMAATAKGNCMAAMEDDVDARLSAKFGWRSIADLRAASIRKTTEEIRNLERPY